MNNSLRLAQSRLNYCDSNGFKFGKLVEKFRKRKDEIEELVKMTNKIKKYLKDNKKTLLREKGEVEKQIFRI